MLGSYSRDGNDVIDYTVTNKIANPDDLRNAERKGVWKGHGELS